MLNTIKQLLQETLVCLILLSVCLFIIKSLIPRQIRRSFRVGCKLISKVSKFTFTQSKKFITYAVNNYKEKQPSIAPQKQEKVANQSNVIQFKSKAK